MGIPLAPYSLRRKRKDPRMNSDGRGLKRSPGSPSLRTEFNFDDSKWWCSARSVLVDTNHFCGRRLLRSKISAALRETFNYHLEGDAKKIRTQSH